MAPHLASSHTLHKMDERLTGVGTEYARGAMLTTALDRYDRKEARVGSTRQRRFVLGDEGRREAPLSPSSAPERIFILFAPAPFRVGQGRQVVLRGKTGHQGVTEGETRGDRGRKTVGAVTLVTPACPP